MITNLEKKNLPLAITGAWGEGDLLNIALAIKIETNISSRISRINNNGLNYFKTGSKFIKTRTFRMPPTLGSNVVVGPGTLLLQVPLHSIGTQVKRIRTIRSGWFSLARYYVLL